MLEIESLEILTDLEAVNLINFKPFEMKELHGENLLNFLLLGE